MYGLRKNEVLSHTTRKDLKPECIRKKEKMVRMTGVRVQPEELYLRLELQKCA